jgi:hypothetical protein
MTNITRRSLISRAAVGVATIGFVSGASQPGGWPARMDKFRVETC